MTRAAVNSRLPLGFLMVAVLLTGAVLAWLMWEAISNLQATRRTVAREAEIEELRSAIVHLDEVLTMSALMAVATGDPSWVERYKEHEPKLEAAIKRAREIAPKAYIGEGAALIDRANMNIVAREKMAFQYLEQDKPEQAQRLLLSEDYEREKQTYAQGMTRFAITPRLNLRLAQLRGRIVHLDEVLTMSARMAAVTGNEKWIDRYRGYEPELGAAIKEAKALAPEAFTREAADQTDQANTKLVDLENEAFKLVGEERLQAAQDLLSSDEYNELKRVYAQGMQRFAQRLKSVANEDLRLARNKAFLSGTATILVIPVLMIGWLFVLRTTRRWQAALVESNRDLAGQTTQLAELNRALEAEVAERKRAEKLQRGRSRVLERLAAGAPLEEVLSILVESAEAVEPDMLCSILLLDDEKKHLRHCAAPSLPDFYNEAVDGLEIGRGVGSCGEAAATGKRVIIEDVLTHPNWAPFRDLAKRAGVRAAWSEPVVSSTGATLATFAMYYREPCRPSPRQLELIASGAQLAGIAIDRKRVEAALQQAHDELEHRVRERTAELAAANQRFRQLAENIDAAFWLASPDEKELYYVSPAYETITNRSCESLYADPTSWLEALHPEDRERALAEAQARGPVPHDDKRESEFRTRRPDDSTGWIWVRSWPVYDAQGALVGRAGIAEDITRRKQAEEALRESEQRFRSAFDHTAVGMALLDLEGRYSRVNHAYCQMLGYTEDELRGRSVQEVTHPEDVAKSVDHVRRLLAGELPGFTIEKRYRHKSGSVVWSLTSVAAVPDDAGNPLYLVAETQDITERKRAEEKLRESETRFRSIFEHAGAGMHTFGPDGRLRQVNPAFCTMLGYSEQKLLKLSLTDVTHPDDLGATRRQFDRMLAGKGAVDLVKRMVREDGAIIWVHLTAVWLTDADQQPLYGVALVQDITERKRAEEELAKHRQHLETLVEDRTAQLKASHARLRTADRLASIGTLTAGLGHDMSNVLLPLRARLDALDWKTVPGRLKELIESIHYAVEYLHQMCVGLRSLAVDAPEGDVSDEVTTLPEWWTEVKPLMKAVLPERVRLEIDLPAEVAPVRVAPHRLTQAVLNLTVNAGEAMPDGGRLRLWAAADDRDGFVQIGITDDGVGMTEEVQLRVLDPFFTTKTRGLSTGLGLSLVHRVVASSGGTMHIDSEPGKGTTVILTLPAADLGAADGGAAPRTQVRAAVSLSDPQTTAWVSILLASAGFEVHRTDDGELDGSRLWITEPTAQNLRTAKRFASGRDRRIIVLGPAARAWTDLGAIVVEESKDLEAIRSALRKMPLIPTGDDR